MTEYATEAMLFKALSEPVRLRILDMLSCGEMCACNLLEHLPISQPTLSHHMKALVDSGLVQVRRSASWMHYSIVQARVEELGSLLVRLTHPKESCNCLSTQGSDRIDGPQNACS